MIHIHNKPVLITSFNEEYDWLSNFYTPVNIILDNERYPSVEHAYQAAKTLDLAERAKFRQNITCGQAKRLGRKVTIRNDWYHRKFHVMRDLTLQKFSDPELAQRLIDTGNAELIEGNTWGDKYWGAVNENGIWVGKNNLGKILMDVRTYLKSNERI